MRTVFCKSTDWKIPLTQFREVLQSDKLLVLRLLLLLHCCLVSVLVSDMQILILLHDGSPLKTFLEIKLLKILDSHPLPPLKKTSAYHIPAFSWQLLPHSSVLEMVCVFFSGNYGNQLDLSVPPSSSSTSPTNAIFDGSYYYFLPWNDIKPCCNVDSHWEDIAFRLEPRNILTRICEQLVSFNISLNRCAKRSIYLRRIDVCIVIFQLGVRLGKSSAGCF